MTRPLGGERSDRAGGICRPAGGRLVGASGVGDGLVGDGVVSAAAVR